MKAEPNQYAQNPGSETRDFNDPRIFFFSFPIVSRRTFGGGACVVSGAEKKAFDRGGPVWPPRSNAADDRLGGVWGRLCPPSQKPGGLGSAPQPKTKNFEFE